MLTTSAGSTVKGNSCPSAELQLKAAKMSLSWISGLFEKDFFPKDLPEKLL